MNTALGSNEEEELNFQIEINDAPYFAVDVVDPNSILNSPQESGIINLGTLRISCTTLYGARKDSHFGIVVKRLHQRHSGGAVETMWVPSLADQITEELIIPPAESP